MRRARRWSSTVCLLAVQPSSVSHEGRVTPGVAASQYWDHKQRLNGRHRRTPKQVKHGNGLCEPSDASFSIGCEQRFLSSATERVLQGANKKGSSYEEKASQTITSLGQRQSPGTKPRGSLRGRVIGKDRDGKGAGRSLGHSGSRQEL